MALIFDSENFIVEAPDQPLVDRFDGGHIIIDPKVKIKDRQQLVSRLAIELARLTIVTGAAMTKVMNQHGVDIGRINYQDNGNWGVFKKEGPFMHMHVYGRAKSAKMQKYGQTLYFPHPDENPEFYLNLKPLTADDRREIQEEMRRLFTLPKFSDGEWGLST